MLLFCTRGCFCHHLTCNCIDLTPINLIKFRNVLNKRSELEGVPVRNGDNNIVTPLVDKHLLGLHRFSTVIINIGIVRSIFAEEPLELKIVFDGIDLCNVENIRHEGTCCGTSTCTDKLLGSNTVRDCLHG